MRGKFRGPKICTDCGESKGLRKFTALKVDGITAGYKDICMICAKKEDYSGKVKSCPSCQDKAPQPIEDFHKSANGADGRDDSCKKCVNQRQRERYMRRVEKEISIGGKLTQEQQDKADRVGLWHKVTKVHIPGVGKRTLREVWI